VLKVVESLSRDQIDVQSQVRGRAGDVVGANGGEGAFLDRTAKDRCGNLRTRLGFSLRVVRMENTVDSVREVFEVAVEQDNAGWRMA